MIPLHELAQRIRVDPIAVGINLTCTHCLDRFEIIAPNSQHMNLDQWLERSKRFMFNHQDCNESSAP